MDLNVVELTKTLVAMPSVSRWSNRPIADYLQQRLESAHFTIERTQYIDDNGEDKINLIAKLGEGTGGLAFCSHMDTVPGAEDVWPAFDPVIKISAGEERMYGRGTCDMKGPLAATLVAALSIDPTTLKKPIYIIATSDEELGLIGAKFMVENSEKLREWRPTYGIIAEPTRMKPVYSHKGIGVVTVTAIGRSAHASTGLGVSANLLIAPFLAEIAQLDQQLKTDQSYMNQMYDPPGHTLNLTIDDGGSAFNVTAARTTAKISVRMMPDSRSQEVIDRIVQMAQAYQFDVETRFYNALLTPIETELVQTAATLTQASPETATYGTDGTHLREYIEQLVVLGPGDIRVAHTTNEFVPIAELHQAVDVYRQMIIQLCVEPQ